MSDEFTPGPWLLNERGDVKSASNEILAIILTLDQREANARLIATAPELLEALEGLLSIITDGLGNAAEAVAARAAIAKARGHE